MEEITQQILEELQIIKQKLDESKVPAVNSDWIPRSEVMRFLGYKDTQMSQLITSGKLKASKVGKRIFIMKSSVAKLLSENSIY
jgi:hypothetical protein